MDFRSRKSMDRVYGKPQHNVLRINFKKRKKILHSIKLTRLQTYRPMRLENIC